MLILPFASGGVGRGRRHLQRGWDRKSSTDGRAKGTVAGNHVGCTAAASTPFPCSVGPLQAASVHNAGVEAVRTEQCVSCFSGAESEWSEKAGPGGKTAGARGNVQRIVDILLVASV